MKTFQTLSLMAMIGATALSSSCTKVTPPAALMPVPTTQQLAWHEMEQYAFIHFTTNTFTDKEWGYGDESPNVFNPTAFDANQWAEVIKNAGLKGIILTCKHHDGFCLWPSAYTEHSIKHSPYMNGKGDIVKSVSDACRKYGLKFGVYLSPWDRNHAGYARPEYVKYYRNQLRELLTEYGEISEVWFDGANGGDGYYGGAREKRTIGVDYYGWDTTYQLVRELAPNAVMFGGPDVRWCGNEKGFVGDPNWCTINWAQATSGSTEDEIYVLNHGNENGDRWIPAEVDVSIRPGWFYHASQDTMVRTPENLFKLYLESVGRGANLLLNIPPDRRGLLHESDVKALQGWKTLLDKAFGKNIAKGVKAEADTWRGESSQYAADKTTDGDTATYWATDDGIVGGSIVIDLGSVQTVSYVQLKEYIPLGQRVKKFAVEAWKDDRWQPIAEGTTIGHKRIVPISPIETRKIRVSIEDARACPLISDIAVF